MRHLHGVIWALIAVCFLALVGCAHESSRAPADTNDLRSGTSTDGGLSPTTQDFIQRNHGAGRAQNNSDTLNRQMALPELQAPQLRGLASAPMLAGFSPTLGTTVLSDTSASKVQTSYGWFTLAVALLFALIYAVRRSNARPDEDEPKFRA